MLDVNTISKLEKIPTPFYLYDMKLLERTVDELVGQAARYGIEVHYAVKANSDPRILGYIASRGLGADCVSGNEVLRALESGFPAGRIAFAGVGKTDREIETAVGSGIFALNCESLQEIEVVDGIAGALGTSANVMVRINPNIDAHTHRYITTGLDENKFGISEHEFDALADLLKNCGNVRFKGLHFHVGSQILDVREVFSLECSRVNETVAYFVGKGLPMENIDLGGGLGIDYEDPDGHLVPDFANWFRVLSEGLDFSGLHAADGSSIRPRIHVEPGRSVVAQCGSLVTRLLYVKHGVNRTFLVTDAGMNDLIRPALYGAYHKVENLSASARESRTTETYDVVGPVCESSDVWGEGRILPESFRGDLLAIRSAGAYGQVMASRYNLRDLAPSVYLDRLDQACAGASSAGK